MRPGGRVAARMWDNLFMVAVGVIVVILLGGLVYFASSPDATVGPWYDAVPTDRPAADQRFLRALGGQISVGRAESEISMGRRACSALDEGQTSASVMEVLRRRGSLTDAQAARVLLAAVTAYCPDNAKKVNP